MNFKYSFFQVIVFFFCCLLLLPVFGQNSEQSDVENGLLRRYRFEKTTPETFNIHSRMAHYNVPGVSIAILKDGALAWAKGYGTANSETGTIVDEHTLFQAGSISKPLAALAALKLWEEGKVDLDADVNQYMKGWKVPSNKYTGAEKVTLRRLLTHTAGTTVHGFPGYAQDEAFPTDIEVLKGKGNTDKITVDTIPGSRWRYSGGGYTIMEKVVEDVSGMSFETYMGKEILHPMGLLNSTYQQPLKGKWTENASAAYDSKGEIIEGLWHNYPEQAAAGLWTTPTDLITYCKEIQEILAGKENGLLKKETIQSMLTKHQNDWGLGPALQWEGDSLVFRHGGKNAGFSNTMVAFARHGDGAVVMTNADNGTRLMGEILLAISNTYTWGISNQDEIEQADIDPSTLKPFTGRYKYIEKVPDIGDYFIEIKLQDGKILIFDEPYENEIRFFPVAPTELIDLDTGDRIKLIQDENDNKVSFLWNNRFLFEKLKTD